MQENILSFLSAANGLLYTYFLVFALGCVGLLYCWATRFVQFRYFFETIRVLRESVKEAVDADAAGTCATAAAVTDATGRAATGAATPTPAAAAPTPAAAAPTAPAHTATPATPAKPPKREHLSPFEALMMSTASRVGIGNIAGIATALALGGPGAIFWMWLMAAIGGASAFAESTLAQVYKQRAGGGFVGGPAYYIAAGLGAKRAAAAFSLILIITYAYGFNGLQSYTMTSAFEYYYPGGGAQSAVGALLAALCAGLFFSRAKSLGRISSLIVPLMALAYVTLAFWAVCAHLQQVPAAIAQIWHAAWDFGAAGGGFAGSAVVIGIKRGLFSNEAGMGSAPNAAAAAATSHPVKQGLIQSFSVFIDLVICTASALLVLFSSVYQSQLAAGGHELSALALMQAAMGEHFGAWGVHFITIAVVLFATTSLLGNFFYAAANVRFFTPSRPAALAFRASCVAMVFIGSQMNLATAWELADFFMAAMASINICAILLLLPVLRRVLADYERQRAEGKEPRFCASAAGVSNTTCWG